jgi:predicted transcriptional regulator YdeE
MRKVIIITTVLVVSLIFIGGMIMFFLFSKMEKEPKIVTLQKPIKFVGLSIKTNVESIYKDAAKLGKEYTNFKEINTIPNLKEPWAFVAYSKDFNEETRCWEYIMGDVVTNLDSIPEGLNGYEIPAATYAIFPIKAKFIFLWGLEIGRSKRYIFTSWLPNSRYKAIGCDFEYHDERSIGRNPSIDLYVAIEEENKN